MRQQIAAVIPPATYSCSFPQLSVRSKLQSFRHVLLAGSTQDRYVPWHSARIELCKAAAKDQSVTGDWDLQSETIVPECQSVK